MRSETVAVLDEVMGEDLTPQTIKSAEQQVMDQVTIVNTTPVYLNPEVGEGPCC